MIVRINEGLNRENDKISTFDIHVLSLTGLGPDAVLDSVLRWTEFFLKFSVFQLLFSLQPHPTL